MKIILVFATGLLMAAPSFAQKTQGKAAPHKAAATPGLSPEKSKMLCKAWKLDSTEQFGVGHKPNAKEANDGVTFMADGTYFITSEGTAANGTWKSNGTYIYTSTGTPETKMMYKLMSLSDDKLEIEYQTPDLIRVHYFYVPKK